MSESLPPGRKAARIILGLLPLVAIACQFVVHIRHGHSVVNFFSFFTNLANLVGGAVLIESALRPGAGADRRRGAAATYLMIVGVVYAALLRNVPLGDLMPWVNTVLHIVTPVGFFLEWMTRPAAARLRMRTSLLWLMFPLAFLVSSMIRGAVIGWYPYPFLNPQLAGGYAGVAIYVLAIIAAFVIASATVQAVGNRTRA